jgi:phosphonate transport system permease protein
MSAPASRRPVPEPPARRWGGLVLLVALLALSVASFAEIGLEWGRLFSADAARRIGAFLGELANPALDPAFLGRLLTATLETLAMSAVGTLLAALMGVLLALAASQAPGRPRSWGRTPTRWLLNVLRSIPELVWAALLLISAGLGPLAGTLALAVHTTGVLGRLFAETLENAPDGPALALRVQGVSPGRVFLYATLPQALPQLMSYTLYRWENNIRAAAVLGVVGGGGLGQMLSFHMGLFHMRETGTILMATLALVALVDLMSSVIRRMLNP